MAGAARAPGRFEYRSPDKVVHPVRGRGPRAGSSRACCVTIPGGAVNMPKQPEGWHTVTPRIVVHDARGFVEFLRQVFGARGEYTETMPSIVTIGDSPVMISDAGARNPMSAFLYVYVDDVDATHRRAVAAGALVHEAPLDTPYGDRRSMIADRWGNTWQIATSRRGAARGKA